MKLLRTHIIFSIIVVMLTVAGCSNNANNKTDTAINVEVGKIKIADGKQNISYSGTVEESETIPLSFSSVGTVLQVFVSEGTPVKKGDLLATLDNSMYQNAYTIAHATELQAEDAYSRLTPMHKNGNLPDVKYVEVETGVRQAKATASIAKKNLDDCNLYATTDGYVGKRSIDPGMSAVPNFASITLVKIEKVFARVPVAENDISSIKKGQKANITIAALNNGEFSGTVEEIGVLADPLAHTYKIKIGIINKNHEIKPGMICNVTLDRYKGTMGIFVPNRTVLIDEQGRNYVYVVSQDKAMKKYVTTGKLLKDGIEIINGLTEGELIVIAGQQKLVDNSSVHVVNR